MEQTKTVLHESIDKMLERGEKIDKMVAQGEDPRKLTDPKFQRKRKVQFLL